MLLSLIDITCARTAGRMLDMTRDRFQGLPEGTVLAPMRDSSNERIAISFDVC